MYLNVLIIYLWCISMHLNVFNFYLTNYKQNSYFGLFETLWTFIQGIGCPPVSKNSFLLKIKKFQLKI
jgi:hypothetical protein